MGSKHKVLVTGGAGFLGSHLCQRLLEAEQAVFCVDNLSSGSQANVDILSRFADFEFIHHDICLPLQLKVDAIYHLACPASPIHYQHDPIQTTKTCVLGALNVLELAKACQAPILFSSTSEIYGDPLVHPQTEDYWGHVNSVGPRSCYDEGKRCAETLFTDYQRSHQVDVRIARIFNTYGPKMSPDDGRVMSNFIIQALKNKPLTLYGNGGQSRSFCYVDDLITGLCLLMAKPKLHTPVNLGNPQEITIQQIANMIIQLTNSHSSLSYHPLPTDDPKQRCPDIHKAISELGWQPKTTLDQGLKKTILYFKKRV